MASIDDFFEKIKTGFSEFRKYIQASTIIKKYMEHKPPYDSLDCRNGLAPHEVVEAYTTKVLFEG